MEPRAESPRGRAESPQKSAAERSAESEEKGARPRGRRAKAKYSTMEQLERAGQALSAAIQEAVERDNLAGAEGRLALSKQRLLPEVEARLSNRELCENFLEHGGLELLGSLLERMPGGCYPNSAFREQVVTLLRGLPVSQEHLSRTRVGSVLVELERSGEELKPTLQKIAEIKQKWSRIVCNLNSTYRDLAFNEPGRTASLLVQRQKAPAPRKPVWKEDEEQVDATKMRRSKVYHDFAEQPAFAAERLAPASSPVA